MSGREGSSAPHLSRPRVEPPPAADSSLCLLTAAEPGGTWNQSRDPAGWALNPEGLTLWWSPRTTIRTSEEDLPSEARPYKQCCTTVRRSVKAEATLIGSGPRPPEAPQGGGVPNRFHPPPASVRGTQERLSNKQKVPSARNLVGWSCFSQQSLLGPAGWTGTPPVSLHPSTPPPGPAGRQELDAEMVVSS